MISRGGENLYHKSLPLANSRYLSTQSIPLLEMRNWCTLFACVSSSLGDLLTTYIVANFSLPGKRPHCRVTTFSRV